MGSIDTCNLIRAAISGCTPKCSGDYVADSQERATCAKKLIVDVGGLVQRLKSQDLAIIDVAAVPTVKTIRQYPDLTHRLAKHAADKLTFQLDLLSEEDPTWTEALKSNELMGLRLWMRMHALPFEVQQILQLKSILLERTTDSKQVKWLPESELAVIAMYLANGSEIPSTYNSSGAISSTYLRHFSVLNKRCHSLGCFLLKALAEAFDDKLANQRLRNAMSINPDLICTTIDRSIISVFFARSVENDALPAIAESSTKLILRREEQIVYDALYEKALTKDQISRLVGGRLYGSNGILTSLMTNGLIKNRRGVGYYRPDAPPPDRSVEIPRLPKSDATQP